MAACTMCSEEIAEPPQVAKRQRQRQKAARAEAREAAG